jgi:hypothetical protein
MHQPESCAMFDGSDFFANIEFNSSLLTRDARDPIRSQNQEYGRDDR